MKKVMSIVLATVLCVGMLFAFVGCSPKEGLVMATNATFPPYEYKDGSGYKGFAGIDVEIALEIAEILDMELIIEDVSFGAIIDGVQSGKYDFGMAGMTVTEDRLQYVNFSDSYAKGVQSVIVREDSPYTSYEDFYTGFDAEENPIGVKDGIKIGVQQSTTGDIYCSDEPGNWGFGKENVERFKTGGDAVQALSTGKVTAVVIDNEPAKAFVAANKGLKILEGSYTDEDYAICVAKKNTELLDKINAALKTLKDNGRLDEIIDSYIK